MARLIKPLTSTQAANAKPRDKMYKLFDGGGLFLQVNPSGGKYWKMKYRKEDGKEGLLSFGRFPAVSLEQARRKRDEAKAQKAAGIDPIEAKKQEKAEKLCNAKNTFEAVALDWLEIHSSKISVTVHHSYKRLLEKIAFPKIGTALIKNLRAPDFLEIFRELEAEDKSSAIKRARSLFSLIMRHAVTIAVAEFDPIPALRGSLKTYRQKHLAAAVTPDEVGRILRLIDDSPASFPIKCALRILPYVFVRPGELREAKWRDIDFEKREWRYTTGKTATPHIVPLCNYVITILAELRELTGQNDYVFTSHSGHPYGKDSLRMALRRTGVTDDMSTPHGFRATARTMLEEILGERYDLIEHQLAHTVRDPNGRAYNRTTHLPERKRMMERWGKYLDNLRNGSLEIPPFNQE